MRLRWAGRRRLSGRGGAGHRRPRAAGSATEIFPRVDAGQLQLRLRAPAGTQIERHREDRARGARSSSSTRPGRRTSRSRSASSACTPAELSDQLDLSLERRPGGGRAAGAAQGRRRPRIEPLKERLRQRFAEQLPGRELLVRAERHREPGHELRLADADRGAVSGPNLAARPRVRARSCSERLAQIPALRDVQFGQSLDYPTVDVNVDRERAGLLGVKTVDVSRSLVAATSSSRFVAPNYWADPNERHRLPGPGADPAGRDDLARGR